VPSDKTTTAIIPATIAPALRIILPGKLLAVSWVDMSGIRCVAKLEQIFELAQFALAAHERQLSPLLIVHGLDR
jgi:hypothetical protein